MPEREVLAETMLYLRCQANRLSEHEWQVALRKIADEIQSDLGSRRVQLVQPEPARRSAAR